MQAFFPHLWRHVMRQILMPFTLGVSVLLSALCLERVLRLIDLVTQSGASPTWIFRLLGFLLPHYLELALPAASFLSALLAFRRMQENSELVIVQAAGQSLRYLLMPALILTSFVVIAMLAISGYIDPYARYDYRAAVHQMGASGQILSLQSGVFTDVGSGVMARADLAANQGKDLIDVFLVSVNKNDESERTFANAKSAHIEKDDETGKVTLYLKDGSTFREKDGQISGRLVFDSYPWDMPNDNADEDYGPRGKDEREMTFRELMHGGIDGVFSKSTRKKTFAELHGRIVQAISVPLFVILALPLALVGSGRAGKAYGIVAGVIIFILYDKLSGFAQAAAATGKISPWVSLWGGLALLAWGSWMALRWKVPTPRRPVRLSGKRKKRLPPGEDAI